MAGETTELDVPLTVEEDFLRCARYAEADDVEHLAALAQENPGLLAYQDDLGRTAVHMAAGNGNLAALRVLVDAGAPALGTTEGFTALHHAAMNNHVACASLLLQSKRWRVSTRNAFGKTALQEIGELQLDEMETLLLSHDDALDAYQCPESVVMDVVAEETLDSSPNSGGGVVRDPPAPLPPAALAAVCARDDGDASPYMAVTSAGKLSHSGLTGGGSLDEVE